MRRMPCSTGGLDQYVRDRLGARVPRRSFGGFAVSVPVPSLLSVSSLPLLKKQAVCLLVRMEHVKRNILNKSPSRLFGLIHVAAVLTGGLNGLSGSESMEYGSEGIQTPTCPAISTHECILAGASSKDFNKIF